MAVEKSPLWQMLQRLDTFFVEQDAPVAQALHPGLSAAELDVAEAELGFPFPQEVRDWYGWHNGMDEVLDGVEGSIRLPNRKLLSSMREAIDARQQFLTPGTEIELVEVYEPTWLPITQADVLTIVVDCAGAAKDRQAPAPVYGIDYEDDWDQQLPSITAMVELWMTLIDQGYWRYDHDLDSWADTYAQIPLEYRRTDVV
jgi:cell wall assembly regulator SMI1